ncbi:MAG: hypothetical protein Crog4KO_27140 [Crocinitomicaceae bacterium]
MLPLFDGFPVFSPDVSGFLASLLVGGLALGALIKARNYFFFLIVLLLFLFIQDQMRWQPWAYMYFSLLLPFALWKKPKEQLLPYFQFILIGVYLWSGIYKFGEGFIQSTFDKMLETLFFIEDAGTRESLHFLGYGIPLIEVALAIGFFFQRTRNISVLFAALSHITILSYLIINEQNSVVYPWNIAMVLLSFLAFFNAKNSMRFWNNSPIRLKVITAASGLFFLILPALSSVGLWDTYLSFKLYSGTNGYFCIGLDKDQYKKVDSELYDCFWKVDEPQGKYWIYVNFWAFNELNVAFYPEMRTYKQVCTTFCESDIPPEKLEFVKFQTAFEREGAVVFDCAGCE